MADNGKDPAAPAAASPSIKSRASDSSVSETLLLASGTMNEEKEGQEEKSGDVIPVDDVDDSSDAAKEKNEIVETAAPVVATSVTKPANDSTNLHSKKQDFVLSFEDLTCYVPGIPSNCCVSKRDNPITNYLEYYLGMQVQERDPFYSLDSCSG